MQYRPFGKTGIQVSALGMGGMRFPNHMENGKQVFHDDETVEMLRHAIDLGVNYFDTAPFYCESRSEELMGRALADGWREKVYLSTKLQINAGSNYDNSRAMLEQSLTRLGTSTIDFYHLWGINWKVFQEVIEPNGPLKMVLKAKDEGLIRHLSFSFHDAPENMGKFIDTGLFESVLCQYNILDTANSDAIQYAHEKGLGVVIMGPVGGGRLGEPSKAIQGMIPGGAKSSPELALRFVLTHPGVSCALSGMGSVSMVDENCAIASNTKPLTEAEQAGIQAATEQMQALSKLYCTGCNYCMPCPQNVAIAENFSLMNLHRVYGLTQHAKKRYTEMASRADKLPEDQRRNTAEHCVGCGLCENRCPQKLKIRKQLAETHRVLG